MNIVSCPPLQTPNDDLFLAAIQNIVTKIISIPIQEEMKRGSLRTLLKSLPLLHCSPISRSVGVTLLCSSEYTHGVGRYLMDALSRWLAPGIILPMVGVASLNFSFVGFPRHRFYVHHVLVEIKEEEDIAKAKHNAPRLIEEIELNIQAVYRARYIAALRSVSAEQKRQLIEQNLAGMLDLSSLQTDSSLFDAMHRVLLKISGEERMDQAKQAMNHLVQSRPKFFDRETFYDMTQFTLLFKDFFASRRSPSHISRLIALHYLFRKTLLSKTPSLQRHMNLRIFPIHKSTTLAVLLGVTLLKESDRIDQRLAFNALRLCIPELVLVEDSTLVDRRDPHFSFFYFELQKPDGSRFLPEEIQQLRQSFEPSLKKLLENEGRLIFRPRNEEDVARNLIVLSHELTAKHGLPQVIIHYERQTDSEIFFSVLLTRLLLPGSKSVRELFLPAPNGIKFSVDEVRSVGKLKQKITKEGAVISACMDKTPFLRSDFSLDSLQARQKLGDGLRHIIGNYRDFNGGMIIKQEEALLALRKQMGPLPQETGFLLESYFYSLRPGIMQATLPIEVLKAHFNLLLLIERANSELLEEMVEPFFTVFIRTKDSHLKDQLDIALEKLQLPTHRFFSSFLKLHKTHAIGYLFRSDQPEEINTLRATIQTTLSSFHSPSPSYRSAS